VTDTVDVRSGSHAVPTDLTDHWVCLDWQGQVLPGVWSSELQALEGGRLDQYADEVSRVARVRDLTPARQADASRRFDAATETPGAATWSR
jgi:hypothetical protein